MSDAKPMIHRFYGADGILKQSSYDIESLHNWVRDNIKDNRPLYTINENGHRTPVYTQTNPVSTKKYILLPMPCSPFDVIKDQYYTGRLSAQSFDGLFADMAVFGQGQIKIPNPHINPIQGAKCECGQVGIDYAKHSGYCPCYTKE